MTRLRIGKSARMAARSNAVGRVAETVMSGPRGGRLREADVAVLFEFVGQLRTARFDDPAGDEDMHELRVDVAQNPGVVRNEQNAAPHRLAGAIIPAGFGVAVDALADHPQGIDVQTGIGLVEDRDLGLQHPRCRNSWRFFSPTEKPSLTLRSLKAWSMSSSSIAALTSLTQCRSLGASPRTAVAAERRKFDIDTPGTSTGYCMAKNRPARARSSTLISRTSSPSSVMEPEVTRYFGWPAMA